jgi:hypothetical protein
MFNKKHFFGGLVLLALLSVALAEELAINKVERQLLLNGPYPIEQAFVEFKS